MKKLMVIATMIAASGLGAAAAFAASTDKPANPGAAHDGQVCPPGDSGKIDVSGGSSVTVTAPEGKLISGYCVKAGSANEDLGPELVPVDPPQKTVTITHSSGKDVSHYSLDYVDEDTTTTTETETTTTETTTDTETTTTETTTETTTTTATASETTTTETPPEETTTVAPAAEEPTVATAPAQESSSSQSGPAVVVEVAGVVATATTPSTAPQAPPHTP